MFKSKKFSNILIWILEIALIAVFVFSVWQVVDYVIESKTESDFNDSLVESAVSTVSPEEEYNISGDADGQLGGGIGVDFDPKAYPDIQVDLERVKEEYPRVVGWLYSPGTPINYPVMQGTDNAFYVDHMPNGRRNFAGSIFMDYRDNANLTDFAYVLYGHNMKNDSMFGTISDYRKEGYLEEHPYMFYFTEDKTYRLEIFAGVNTVSTSKLYLEPEFEDRESFIASAFEKSTFVSGVTVTPEDRIFQISTCSGASGQNKRYMIFAKLTEI